MSSLLLGDLNDYLEPSQACIKPPTTITTPTITSTNLKDNNIQKENDENIIKEKNKESISISLTDCLACSGCITSAESILITQQTHYQLLDQIEMNLNNHEFKKTIVISISPQSRAAIAKRFNLSLLEAMKRITSFFKDILGQGRAIAKVFDTTFARHFGLIELKREMKSRLEKSRENENIENIENSPLLLPSTPLSLPLLPLISSSCPGWICYAEKKYPDFLHLISKVKSPQQIMGSLVKYKLFQTGKDYKRADQIYHVTVMPCFDKKLEASREDFYNSNLNTRDVDCVITTTELLSLIQSKCDFMKIDLGEIDYEFSAIYPLIHTTPILSSSSLNEKMEQGDHVFGHKGNGSGGYLEYLLDAAQSGVLCPSFNSLMNSDTFASDSNENSFIYNIDQNENVNRETFQIRENVKNNDYREYFVTRNRDQKIIFSAVAIYGFKNIQSFVIKRRANRIPAYDFIEIMACPQGCINGGGQPKPIVPDGIVLDRKTMYQYLKDLEKLYQSIHGECNEEKNENLKFYLKMIENDNDKEGILMTNYRPVLFDIKKNAIINASRW